VAASTRKLCVALAFAWASHALAAAPKLTQEPIDLTAQSQETDAKNKTVSLRKVRIAQGDLVLTADQAQFNGTGLESAFDDAIGIFRGSVKLSIDQGILNADEARVTFAHKVLIHAVVVGKPATFQQKIAKTGKVAHGHANNIDYVVATGIVRLTQDAFLDNGQYEVHAESLKYDLIKQISSAEAADQDSQRVHIIITPPPPKAAPAPTP
jgi:lipopolysaccharide transport protein LptA